MANRLKMAKIDAILALHLRQWSIRRIAKELGLHRDTVARHIQACQPRQNRPGRSSARRQLLATQNRPPPRGRS